MQQKWIALTAGLGTSEFEAAADRVKERLEKFPQINMVKAVKSGDLRVECPRVFEKYEDYLNSRTKGYGYMAYKAELVQSAFEGAYGECDGVIWVDAGCEVVVNSLSKKKLDDFINYAEENGVACFTLDTDELMYTKRDLFRAFPSIDPESAGPQIQTTWFLLHGSTGKQVSQEWLRVVMDGIENLDLSPSRNGEHPEFIEHRNDQSIFSLVCKELEIKPMAYKPVNGNSSFKSSLRGIPHPFWTSRNRTGQTTIPGWVRLLERIDFVDRAKPS